MNVLLFLIAEPLILVLGAAGGGGAVDDHGRAVPAAAAGRSSTPTCSAACRPCSSVILAGFGIPALQLQGMTNDTFWLGLFALVLSYGAYVAEVFRAGIDSVHPSQLASADALGLSHGQAMRYVVLPQATRRVVPPLLNDFVSLQKDTALLSAIFVFEALFTAQDYASYNFNYTPIVVVAVLLRGADHPAGAVHRLDGPPDDAPRAGGGPMTGAAACCVRRTCARPTATRSCCATST